MRITLTASALLAAALAVPPAPACTSVQVKTSDGYVFYARTMEGDTAYGASLSVVPAGTRYFGTLPDNTQNGLKWAAKYGFVGANNATEPVITDGINDQGLAVGMLFFTGYADYQKFEPTLTGRTLAHFEVATWLLSNFATVAEVKAAIGGIRVCHSNKVGPLPLHYTVHDAGGACVVIEYTNGGELKVYDNPFGVMTNSPDFGWQVTNLKNYVNISAFNAPAVTIGEITASGFGQGTGMLGLPGDYTPPSRFVRMVALTQSAAPVRGPDAGLNLAMTIINACDIPYGAVRDMTTKPPNFDHTVWTAVADLKQLRYYYHTYENKSWSYIDVKAALANAKQVMTLPLFTKPGYTNTTAAAANYTNPDPKYYTFGDKP